MKRSLSLSMRPGPKTRSRRLSCPAKLMVPLPEKERSSRTPEKLAEPAFAPGKGLATVKYGFRRTLDVFQARYHQMRFRHVYSILKAPLRNAATRQDLNHILTLISFLSVNLFPVYLFSWIVCLDYTFLGRIMPLWIRLAWLNVLHYITWGCVSLYAVNITRLLITMMTNSRAWWLDWEETIYLFIRPRVTQRLKNAATSLWESWHHKCWSFIRGIQAKSSEQRQVIQEVCVRRNLPPLVQETICDFVNLKGMDKLDYRWYLHDNRKNSPMLKHMNYECREAIASFLIPKPAFALDKDEIVDLFCQS